VDPRDGLDSDGKSRRHGGGGGVGAEPRVTQSVASRYTDYTIQT
jgi:hypothetical protein